MTPERPQYPRDQPPGVEVVRLDDVEVSELGEPSRADELVATLVGARDEHRAPPEGEQLADAVVSGRRHHQVGLGVALLDGRHGVEEGDVGQPAEALEECTPPVGGHNPTEDDGRAQRAATWQLEEALEIGFDDAAAVGSPAGQYE